MSDYFDSGYSVREPMWHGKGKVAGEYPKDWNEAREWAGLMWEPELVPFYTKNDDGEFVEVQNWRAIRRNDDGRTLGVRTDSFKLFTHEEMGRIMEALLEQPNLKYETAGATHFGARVWALVYLDEPVTIPGDNSITLPYMALTNRHDGTGAFRAQPTTVKIVCANTFAAAEAEGDRNGVAFTFQHRGTEDNWEARLEEARATVMGLRADFNRYVELATELLKVRVNREQSEQFINSFIPSPPVGLVSQRVKDNVDTARDTMRTILASPTSEGIADTAWGLVQAAGEYLDHYRAYRSLDSYYTRQLLAPEKLKTRAVKIAREVALV